MKNHLRLSATVVLLGLVSTGLSYAETPNVAGEYPGWIVGAGYVKAPDPFVGDADDASQFIPIVGYLGERLTWMGPYVGCRLFGGNDASVSLVAEVRFDGFNGNSVDPLLRGLLPRKEVHETCASVE